MTQAIWSSCIAIVTSYNVYASSSSATRLFDYISQYSDTRDITFQHIKDYFTQPMAMYTLDQWQGKHYAFFTDDFQKPQTK